MTSAPGQNAAIYFDIVKFLTANFSNPARVVSFLRAYDYPQIPDEEAVRKWFSRGRVPGEWLIVLLAYLEIDKGSPVALAPYLGHLK